MGTARKSGKDYRASGTGLACPCGSGRASDDCCRRWHRERTGEGIGAPDAEALMRSRYTAYVLGLHDYLLETWHSSRRPAGLEPDPPGLRWLGLEVRSHRQIDDSHAEVEFVARSRLAGRAHRLHERSRFVRESGRWYYLDGDLLGAASP